MNIKRIMLAVAGLCSGVVLGATPGCFDDCEGDPQLASGTYPVREVRSGLDDATLEDGRWASVPVAEGGLVTYEWEREMRLVYTPPSGVETTVIFRPQGQVARDAGNGHSEEPDASNDTQDGAAPVQDAGG